MASAKWTPFCRTGGSAWDSCSAANYWTELENRYGNSPALPDNPTDPESIAGEVAIVKLYFQGLFQSVSQVVQSGSALPNLTIKTKNDSQITMDTRLATTISGAAVKFIVNKSFIFAVESGTGIQRGVQQSGLLKYVGRVLGPKYGLINDIKTASNSFAKLLRSSGLKVPLILGAVAIGIGALTTLAEFLYVNYSPQTKLAVNFLVNFVGGGISIGLTIKSLLDFTSSSIGAAIGIKRALGLTSEILGTSKVAGVVGTVIAIGVTWGFFIYSVVSEGLSPGDPAFGKGLGETIATTIYLIVLGLISATVFGTILVGILSLIDGILTAACELDEGINGKTVLRKDEYYGGACVTISATVIKAIAYLLYNYDVMVDTTRTNLVQAGSPKTTLSNPDLGFVNGNSLSITFPITTTITHKDPDPENSLYINLYSWLFSADNLRSTTFRYSLTAGAPRSLSVERDQMPNDWRNVVEDHKFGLATMYRGHSTTTAKVNGINLSPGLNRTPTTYL